MVAQLAYHRDSGQRLATDRAGIGEFPAGLRAAHPAVDQAFLGRSVGLVSAMYLGAEELVSEPYRAAPEWKCAVPDPLVEFGPHAESVVPVIPLICQASGNLVPDRAPGRC